MIESNRERAIRILAVCASALPAQTIRETAEALGIQSPDAVLLTRRMLVGSLGGGMNWREVRAEACQRLREAP